MKTVVIVDDHALIRSGIAQALSKADYSIIGQAASKAEALAVLNNTSPDFCIVDLNLGDGLGSDLIAEVRHLLPKTKFVILTMDDDNQSLELAKASGADSFILKSAPIDSLLNTLIELSKNPAKFRVVGKVLPKPIVINFDLTPRENQILQSLGDGSTAAAMGAKLFLTEATIKTHLSAIYRKLNASNRTQALSIAIENNLIKQ
jgi:DNA-binding NarL/FixJ family response regulator